MLIDQPIQFSTKRYDADTGLSYYGYRFYSPAIGKWITRDPIGETGGLNLYGFVNNNPMNFIDPMGLRINYICVRTYFTNASEEKMNVLMLNI
jgi:RHS repeat-associated protein